MTPPRLELQERIRQLQKDPTEEERADIEHQRSIMSAEFEILDEYLRRSLAVDGNKNSLDGINNCAGDGNVNNGRVSIPTDIHKYTEDTDQFQNLDDNQLSNLDAGEVEDSSQSLDTIETIRPEKRPLIIPSTSLPFDHKLCKLELHLRQQQAHRYINALQEVIAEKSFQFTNIMRVAPRKSVITRARGVIVKLNFKIQFYAKVYCRCRAALIRLGADKPILDRFRNLTREDVKASSAIKDPNIPGSSSLRLSWIWQLSSADANSPSYLRECKKYFLLNLIIIMYYLQFTVFIGYVHVPNVIGGEKRAFS